jgi:hypothetical protein
VVGIEPSRAGGLPARKWQLPPDIVQVIEHHSNPDFRGDYWPISLLVGYCALHAGAFFPGNQSVIESDFPSVLGIEESIVNICKQALVKDIEGIGDMAQLLSGKGSENVQ